MNNKIPLFDERLAAPLIVPSNCGSKRILLDGYFVPDTDHLMFIHESKRNHWWTITHTPSGGKLTDVGSRDEAIFFAKRAFDLAMSHRIDISSSIVPELELRRWTDVIVQTGLMNAVDDMALQRLTATRARH